MISPLIAQLSLAMTERMVDAGFEARTFAIAHASNTSPILLTMTEPHNLAPAFRQHVVISGVEGNTAANGLWELSYVSENQFALLSYSPSGELLASEGNGEYVSGGIAKSAFPDGRILTGRRHLSAQSAVATPRIVFIPYGSPSWSLDPYGGVLPSLEPLNAEQARMKLARQLATEPSTFEVHVSGCAVPPDPDAGDFDVTQAIYRMLFGVMFDMLSPSRFRVLKGQWTSQTQGTQNYNTHGQKWVGMVEIQQAVTDRPLEFIPIDTIGSVIVNLQSGDESDAVEIIIGEETP